MTLSPCDKEPVPRGDSIHRTVGKRELWGKVWLPHHLALFTESQGEILVGNLVLAIVW